MQLLRSVAAALVLGAAATAQCGTLSITQSAAGLAVSLSATPMSIAVLAIGETAGTTSIPIGTTTLELGLLMPFSPFPLGFTDATGSAGGLIRVPPNLPLTNLFAQGVAVSFGTPPNFALSFCTSNVVAFTVGS